MIAWWDNIMSVGWVHNVLWILYLVTVIGVVGVVISENRNPVKSLAWITVLILLPGLGILIYIVFGRSIRNLRMISRRKRRRLRTNESFRKIRIEKLHLSEESKQQITLGRKMTGALYYPANNVTVFTKGQDKFDALFKDIEHAKKYINIQYYILSDDNIGRRLQEALIKKANEGVVVRVIYDSVGSYSTSGKFFKEMAKHGIKSHPFFKVVFPIFGTRVNWRNHRKLCIIDGNIGYVGGMNVADRYIDGGKEFAEWRDTHLRIAGPAVGALQYSFAVDWSFMGGELIEESVMTDPGSEHDEEGVGLQLITSGPTSQWSNVGLLFLKAIGNAKKRVYLQTPYFLPTDGLLKALQSSALSGVDVRVMIPRKSDSVMLNYASSSYITECLQAGVKFYFYEAGMLHAKMLIVDDEFVSIGSTNFDFRSFEHNFEANMQIYSPAINAQMVDTFRQDMQNSARIDANEWRRRSPFKKFKESVVRLLSPVL